MTALADLAVSEALLYSKAKRASKHFRDPEYRVFREAVNAASLEQLQDAFFELVGRLAGCYSGRGK